MAEFTNQAELQQQLISQLSPMMSELEAWKTVWDRLSDDKKMEWLVDGKSLFLSAAAGIYIYLHPFFKTLADEIESGKITLNTDDMAIERIE